MEIPGQLPPHSLERQANPALWLSLADLGRSYQNHKWVECLKQSFGRIAGGWVCMSVSEKQRVVAQSWGSILLWFYCRNTTRFLQGRAKKDPLGIWHGEGKRYLQEAHHQWSLQQRSSLPKKDYQSLTHHGGGSAPRPVPQPSCFTRRTRN
jgi:hypothetical protein